MPSADTHLDVPPSLHDEAEDLLYDAWCVIANSGLLGSPGTPTPGADVAAALWRDRYHDHLSQRYPILNNEPMTIEIIRELP